MSREIKFKAWAPMAKKMYDVTSLDMDDEGVSEVAVKVHEAEGITYSSKCPINTLKLRQYTGLKDSKGTEIYEGDIVFDHMYKFNLGITWCDGKGEDLGNQVGWWLDDGRYKVELRAYLGIEELDREEYANVSIIGNIYEMPELLPKDDS